MFEIVSLDNGVALVEEMPAWIQAGIQTSEISKLISPLIRFFVIESPVEGLSARRVPFSVYGWNAPWKKPEWLNRKLKDVTTNKCFYWSCRTANDIERALRGSPLGLGPVDTTSLTEVAVIYDCKRNQTMSLFYHIRNSLAHGRFCAFRHGREVWFAFEDVQNSRSKDSNNSKKLTARILVKNSTLLKWIKLIKGGPGNATD